MSQKQHSYFVEILILFIKRSILKTGNQIKKTLDACQRKEHGWIQVSKNTHALMRLEKLMKIQKSTLGGQIEAMLITTMLDGGLIIKSITIIFPRLRLEHQYTRRKDSRIMPL